MHNNSAIIFGQALAVRIYGPKTLAQDTVVPFRIIQTGEQRHCVVEHQESPMRVQLMGRLNQQPFGGTAGGPLRAAGC